MDFRPTEDQLLFASGVREFLAAECTPDHLRRAWASGQFDHGRWKGLADLGVLGVTIPAEHGGMGLDERDLVGILVESGRAALPEPLLEVAAVAAPLLADLGGNLADEWLPRIASGDAMVVPVLPELDPYPAHVRDADLLLVGAGDRLWAVAPSEVEVVDQPTIDRLRPTVGVGPLGGMEPMRTGPEVARALSRAAARGATAAAAVLVGAGHAMIDLAVAYAGQREQFGRPIGAFQAVKHHLADALVDVTFALPLVERSAHSLATGDADAAIHAAMAKAFAAEAAEAAASHCLQVHGAIGYTSECDLHVWMKRAWSLSASWGDTERHWQAVETAVV